jgi:hypothetical protein
MSSSAPTARRPVPTSAASAGTPAVLGVVAGIALTCLGLSAALWPSLVDDGDWWLPSAGVAILLFVGTILRLRAMVADVPVARRSLGAAAVLFTLFGTAHFYALVDEDTAILAFSVLMVCASVAMIVAGTAVARARTWAGRARFLPLLVGAWPIVTVPAGAAIGDVPHFLAIAVWGAPWTALGLTLLRPRLVRG